MIERMKRLLTDEELAAIEKQLAGRAKKGEGARARKNRPARIWVWLVSLAMIAAVGGILYWWKGGACVLVAAIIIGVMFLLAALDPKSAEELPRAERAKRTIRQLRGREVKILRIQAAAAVEMEEIEDEGPAWFLQVGPAELLCLRGQTYNKFKPSADFDVIDLGGGEAVFWHRGERLNADRVWTGEEKESLLDAGVKLPRDGEAFPGALETLDGDLRARSAGKAK